MFERRLLISCILVASLVLTPGCRAADDRLPNVLAAAGPAAQEPLPLGEAGAAVQLLSPDVEVDPPLFVYVSGAVVHPGVYQLPPGARGCDALAAAGGSAKDARLELVNLAALLTDGQQLHIPSRSEAAAYIQPGSGITAKGGTRGPVNVNRAATAELMDLPGIGAVLAGRIIAYRSEHGPFTQVDDLLAVPGIGESKLKDIKSLVSVGP